MSNPHVQQAMAKATVQRIETRFKDLMDGLGMSADERTRFVTLLADREMLATELRMNLVTTDATDTNRRALLLEELRKTAAESEANVRDFFGDSSKFYRYQDWVKQEPARSEVATLENKLAQGGAALSSNQAADMQKIVYQVQSTFRFSTDLSDFSQIQPPMLKDPATAEAYFTEMQCMNELIEQRAAGVLNPEQLALLRRQHGGKIETLKASFKHAFGTPH